MARDSQFLLFSLPAVGIVDIFFALISLPFLWMGIFVLLHRHRSLSALTILIHYLTAIVLLTIPRFGHPFADWNYFMKTWALSPALLVSCGLWYAAGQIFLWTDFASQRSARRS
jgi:hypothetical protein